MRRDEPTLVGARRKYEAAYAQFEKASVHLRSFKDENQLRRDILNDDRKIQLMWVFVIVVVEGLLNSWFFQDAFTSGLAGGFLMAFLVSGVNVSFAFIAGVLGLRYLLNHINAVKQLGGAFVFVACIMICSFIVSMTALFRGSMDNIRATDDTLFGDDLLNPAWENAKSLLLNFELFSMFATFGSFIVFFVGFICAILGIWKGYEYDDPYPGYGPLHRTVLEAEVEADEAREEYEDVKLEAQQHRVVARDTLRELAIKLSGSHALIKRNFVDYSTNPETYRLDEHLQKLAFETYSLYYQSLRQLVSVPNELPKMPVIEIWPGNVFVNFTVENFSKERLEAIVKAIETAIKEEEEIKLREEQSIREGKVE